MGWTTPRTWITGEVVTAAEMNTHIRDNETALQPQSAAISTIETTASTAYTNLATVGPAVTLVTGTLALVTLSALSSTTSAGAAALMSVAVTGATTLAANDATAYWVVSFTGGLGMGASAQYLISGLTAGTNTFTAKYRVGAGTGSWQSRSIVVEACY